jgi:hydroxymethylbilane synthase
MTASRKIRIGTRRSRLAMIQAGIVLSALLPRWPDCEFETVGITTSGDRLSASGAPLPEGKGIFVKEIEQALLDRRIDLAVHSMKDLPAETPDGLRIGALPRRARPNDALVSRDGETLSALKRGAVIGTGSPRRSAQLLAARTDLIVADIRGNVETRVRKTDEGRYDAIVLAYAGLDRLGLSARISEIFSLDVMIPAVGQGALALEIRSNDAELSHILGALNDEDTAACVAAERSLLKSLGGGCANPIAAVAEIQADGKILLRALVGSCDGKRLIKARGLGERSNAVRLGEDTARDLLSRGARELLDKER